MHNPMKYVSMAFFIFLVACSSTPEQTIVSDNSDQTACLSKLVGHLKLSSWCSVLPEEQAKCECGTELLTKRVKSFSALAEDGKAPVNLRDYYRLLDNSYTVTQIHGWMNTGIPMSAIKAWAELGLTPEETKEYYELGFNIKQAQEYLVFNLDIDELKRWVGTGIKKELWNLWIDEMISPEVALRYSKENDLMTGHHVSSFLSDRRFKEIDESVKPHSWICSRGNLAAQVLTVSKTRVTFIQRFRLVDAKGYPLSSMMLFNPKVSLNNLNFSYSVRRNFGVTHDWSSCPISVDQHLNKLYAVN
jgi:hypothetical protein